MPKGTGIGIYRPRNKLVFQKFGEMPRCPPDESTRN